MKRTRNCWGWAIVLISISAVIPFVGCTDSKKPLASPPSSADPSAAFNRVVENLRHYLSQLQSDPYTAIENGAFTDFRHSREVTHHQFIPPAAGSDDYRGTITVATRWIYSFRPAVEPPAEESNDTEKSQPSSEDKSADETVREGIEVLDPEVVADLKSRPKLDSSPIAPKSLGKSEADEEVRTFRFVYRNNRWELVNEPVLIPQTSPGEGSPGQPKPMANDEALEDAVHRALRQQ